MTIPILRKGVYALTAITCLLCATEAHAQRAIRGASLILDDNGSPTTINTITLTPPAAGTLTNNYQLTLPTGLPGAGATGLFLVNEAGQMSLLPSTTAQNSYILVVQSGVPTYVDPTSAGSPYWAIGGNTNPTSTILGNQTANGDLDLNAGGVTRLSLNGATGMVTAQSGLTVTTGGATITGNSSITGALNMAGAASPLQMNGSAGTAGSVLVSQGATSTPVWSDLININTTTNTITIDAPTFNVDAGTTTTFNGDVIFVTLPDLPLQSGHMLVGNASNIAAPLAPGLNFSTLTIVAGQPTWVEQGGPNSTSWDLGGNTTPTSNVFGTISNTSVEMRSNNIARLTLPTGDATQQIRFNTLTTDDGVAYSEATDGVLVVDADGDLSRKSLSSLLDASSWLVGGNTSPASTIIGNNGAGGNLDVNAGAATRIAINGTTGLVTVNDGLSVSDGLSVTSGGAVIAGAAPTDSRVTLGSATSAGTVNIFDGSDHQASIGASALAANHQYNMPNIGAAAAAADIVAATGQGTTNQILVSAGPNAPAVWTTNPTAGLESGIADPTDGALTIDVSTTADLTPTSRVYISMVSNVGPGAFVSAIDVVGNAFTVTMPGPAAPGEVIHWFVIP